MTQCPVCGIWRVALASFEVLRSYQGHFAQLRRDASSCALRSINNVAVGINRLLQRKHITAKERTHQDWIDARAAAEIAVTCNAHALSLLQREA